MTYHHTMRKPKIAITVDETALAEIDRLVAAGVFPNRSNAIESAVHERIEKLRRSCLARECAKLDPIVEQSFANERYVGDMEAPAY